MEKKLKQLFDFQRFTGNKRLDSIIKQAETSYGRILSDEEMEWVNAAGEPQVRRKKGIVKDDEI